MGKKKAGKKHPKKQGQENHKAQQGDSSGTSRIVASPEPKLLTPSQLAHQHDIQHWFRAIITPKNNMAKALGTLCNYLNTYARAPVAIREDLCAAINFKSKGDPRTLLMKVCDAIIRKIHDIDAPMCEQFSNLVDALLHIGADVFDFEKDPNQMILFKFYGELSNAIRCMEAKYNKHSKNAEDKLKLFEQMALINDMLLPVAETIRIAMFDQFWTPLREAHIIQTVVKPIFKSGHHARTSLDIRHHDDHQKGIFLHLTQSDIKDPTREMIIQSYQVTMSLDGSIQLNPIAFSIDPTVLQNNNVDTAAKLELTNPGEGSLARKYGIQTTHIQQKSANTMCLTILPIQSECDLSKDGIDLAMWGAIEKKLLEIDGIKIQKNDTNSTIEYPDSLFTEVYDVLEACILQEEKFRKVLSEMAGLNETEANPMEHGRSHDATKGIKQPGPSTLGMMANGSAAAAAAPTAAGTSLSASE